MFSTILEILEILVLIILGFIFLFFIFCFSVFLFAPSRDSAGFINECVGCGGEEEIVYDWKTRSYIKACEKCPYNPELYEWDPELQMDVRKKKR